MAPDRRFGLPHPLDSEPTEDSSRRKSGLWESFKRALGSSQPEPSAFAETAPRPLPQPPPAARPPARPVEAAPPPLADPIPSKAKDRVEAARRPPTEDLLSDVPFLEDLPFESSPAPSGPPPRLPGPPPLAAAAEPEGPSKANDAPAFPASDPLEEPRLARGLASFSRDNAAREKKFAHLLRDQPGGEQKKPGSPRRRR